MKRKHESLPDFIDNKASDIARKLRLAVTRPQNNEDWIIGYDWGAYDGYKAGFRAGRKFAKQRR